MGISMKKYKTEQSRLIWEKEKRILPGGCHFNFHGTKMVPNIIFKEGNGSRLWDVDGNEYLDLYAKSGTMILGHSNQKFIETMKQAMYRIVSVNDTQDTIKAIERIQYCFPDMEMLRFGLSGSEVIQNALRVARGYTNRQKIVRFKGHFHGSADNILGNQADENGKPYDDLTEVNSTEGRYLGALQETYILPWNDINVLQNLFEQKGNEIAAVIMEPIMVNNGSIMPKRGYLEEVRRLCDKFEILLIFDEIITGFRVGMGGAQKLLQVTPDLSVIGKAISNGFVPVSVLGGKKEIMQMYADEKVAYLGTYNGYPLAIASINATLDQLDERAYKYMMNIAQQIANILKKSARKFYVPFSIQGPDLCMSYHFKDNIISQYSVDKRETARKAVFYSVCASYGILFAAPSRIYLNTAICDEDLAFFEERIYEAFKDLQDILG